MSINTIEELWEQTIIYQQEGLIDSEAMYKVNREMSPRLTYLDIANACSGVYSDTYWINTSMDSEILAKHMVQGLGLDLNEAQDIARQAMSQWRGTLLRKNFSDTGHIPAQGSVTSCPDIVCNQNTPLASLDQLIENWNSSFWKTPQVGANYVYTRCQNLQFLGSITNPWVEMFYSDAGFNIPPQSWVRLYTYDGAEQKGKLQLISGETGPIPQGIRVAGEAFRFEPKSQDHFCLIATVGSDFFKRNDPSIYSTNWDSAKWLNYNGAAAWHNVNPQISNEAELKFHNLDGRPEQFAFEAHCNKVPAGTVISLECQDPKITGLDSGRVKIAKDYHRLSAEASVPGNLDGKLLVRIDSPSGKLLPEESSVEVRMLWVLDHRHQHYSDAVNLLGAHQQARVMQNIHVPLGSFTFIGTKH